MRDEIASRGVPVFLLGWVNLDTGGVPSCCGSFFRSLGVPLRLVEPVAWASEFSRRFGNACAALGWNFDGGLDVL